MLCLTAPFFIFIIGVDSARILGIFPGPSISHQVVFDAYVHELVKHGHQVVTIAPNLTPSKDRPNNLTEIHARDVYENKAADIMGTIRLQAKRGVITDVDLLLEGQVYPLLIQMTVRLLKDPEVKRLIDNQDQHFDLVVAEALTNYHLIVGKIFNAPVILLSSFHGMPETFDIMGAVSVHPMLFPNIHRNKLRDLTLLEKIMELYQEFKIRSKFKEYERLENQLLKQNFGPDAPSVNELNNNVAMLFVNAHWLFANNRPVPPSVVYLGGLHLNPVKELPQDLKLYLDSSKRGVVYVSLGSNVNPANMHREFRDAFLDAFEALPFDVLWKFDGDNLGRMPKNLKIKKWFPQRDLLSHPNIKVFITQGGQQSTDEAIDSGVPLVGIPMHGDQWWNTNRYVQLGIGVQLDSFTLTAVDIVKAVKTVIADESYRRNIKQVRAVMYDQPQLPLERAVWWTEHVLRHGGGQHLRAPAANMSWTEYLMFDVLITFIIMLMILLLILICLVRFAVKYILKLLIKKSKVKSN